MKSENPVNLYLYILLHFLMVFQLSLKMPLNSQRMALKTTLNILNKRSFKIKDIEKPWILVELFFKIVLMVLDCNNDLLKLQGDEFLS